MTTRAASLVLLFLAHCAVDRSGFQPTDAGGEPRFDAGFDAQPPVDGAMDAPNDAIDDAPTDAPEDAPPPDTGFDSGVDPRCSDGLRSPDETDVDCGGPCAPCAACLACRTAADCEAPSTCVANRCSAIPSAARLSDGTSIPAFVRGDGAVLLAHYDAQTYVSAFDPFTAQVATPSGGGPAGGPPLPCGASGHLEFDRFDPAERTVEIECGPSRSEVDLTISSTLFTAFAPGDYGTVGAEGTPGWANIAAIGSGVGRSRFGSCGSAPTGEAGGLAFCSGPSTGDYGNHLASYSIANNRAYVGCDRMGCSGGSCDLELWVWLLP